MFNVQTSRGMYRRYLLWFKYDGSRFNEMATGSKGLGIMDTIHRCLEYAINPSTSQRIRIAPSSRTDTGVHALRTTALAHIPIIDDEALDETPEIKEKNLSEINRLLNLVNPESIKLLDFHSVSPGFGARKHVEYRHYAYRLVVPKSWENCYPVKPSLPLISEQRYSWILTPRFDVNRAAEACKKLEGVHNIASFYKHQLRHRLIDLEDHKTLRWIRHIGITRGGAYSLPSPNYDYYVINFISRSFIREQIRRMVSVIVSYAYGRIQLRDIDWLLTNPDPQNFFAFKRILRKAAIPNGLFLADVVYDPQSFYNPSYCINHGWDVETDEIENEIDEENETDEEIENENLV